MNTILSSLKETAESIESLSFEYDERTFMSSMGFLTEFIRDKTLHIGAIIRSGEDLDSAFSYYNVLLGYCNLYQDKLSAHDATALSLRMRYGSS